MDELAIYRRLVGARIRADAQYRVSFVLYTVGQFGVTLLDLLAILVIFGQVSSLAGWSLSQVMFLYAVSGIGFALGDVFISQVEMASIHIKQGTFDQFLIRPMGPLVQLSASEFALRRAGRLLQPLVIFGIVLAQLDVVWSPARVVVLVSTVLSAFVLFSSLWVITSSVSFWTVDSQEVANSFTYGGNFATQYPLDVLSVWLRRFAVVVPIAFVNYLPATWLLGKPDVFGLPVWVRLSSPVVALVAALVARAVWRTAIRHYRSTGS